MFSFLLLLETNISLLSAYSQYDFGIFENQPLLENLLDNDKTFTLDMKNLMKESNESEIVKFLEEESVTIEVIGNQKI